VEGCLSVFNGYPEIITEKTGIKNEILTALENEASG
jgi:hypothetical protein